MEVGSGAWVGNMPNPRFPTYTRGNAGEVYPNVFSPLTFTTAAAEGEAAMRRALERSGVATAADHAHGDAVSIGVFGGYAYLNLSYMRVSTGRFPGVRPTDSDETFLGTSTAPPYRRQRGDRNLLATLRATRFVWRTLGTTDVPALVEIRDEVDRFLAGLPDPATASDEVLAGLSGAFVPFFSRIYEEHLFVSQQAGVAVGVLTTLCEQLGDRTLAVRMLAGIGEVSSAAPSQDLWELGRMVAASPGLTAAFEAGLDGLAGRLEVDPSADGFRTAFTRFLRLHGHRGANEWDTMFETWETDPTLALALVDRLRLSPAENEPARRAVELAADREAATAEAMALAKGPRRWLLRRALRSSHELSRAREDLKTTVVRAIHGLRLAAKELGRRCAARAGSEHPDDMWFVTVDEIDAYVAEPAAVSGVIARRRAMHAVLSEREPPFVFTGIQPPPETWPLRSRVSEPLEPGTTIVGFAACPGRARGPARVVLDPADPRGLMPGDVLVAPHTDPAWTPLFVAAAAVVVDVGAVLSHAAIVSRELGLPCVVSATGATRTIPDGAIVEVDGTAGTVTVVSVPPG